jgi:hypothetical protein
VKEGFKKHFIRLIARQRQRGVSGGNAAAIARKARKARKARSLRVRVCGLWRGNESGDGVGSRSDGK